MKTLRAVLRIIALTGWFVPVFLWSVCTNFGNGPASWKRAVRIAQTWARGALRLLGVRVIVHGEAAQSAGTLVVCNHQSTLDILVCAALLPIRFASKEELRRTPVFGLLTSQGRPIWINRSSRQGTQRVLDAMCETLAQKLSLLVYPEGTTTDGKHGLLPFKSTAFAAAIASGAEIQPVLLRYADQPAGEKDVVQWFDSTPFPVHLWRILGLKSVTVDVYIMDKEKLLPGEERKELAERMWQLMSERYAKEMEQHE